MPDLGKMPAPGKMPPMPAPPKPKPKSPRYDNPFEMIKEESKNAAKAVGDIPVNVAQGAVDQMWASIYGVDSKAPQLKAPEAEPTQDNFTKLNIEKLHAAQAKGDLSAIESIQQRLQEHAEDKQENAARHTAVKQDEERAIYELEKEEQERLKAIAEEEQMKKEQEARADAANNQMAGSGAGKSKQVLGGARKRASTETNFEAGQGKNGK